MDQGWGAVSHLSLFFFYLSQKFKHDLWRLMTILKLSQKQHLDPGACVCCWRKQYADDSDPTAASRASLHIKKKIHFVYFSQASGSTEVKVPLVTWFHERGPNLCWRNVFVCLPACLSVCPSVCLSVCLTTHESFAQCFRIEKIAHQSSRVIKWS